MNKSDIIHILEQTAIDHPKASEIEVGINTIHSHKGKLAREIGKLLIEHYHGVGKCKYCSNPDYDAKYYGMCEICNLGGDV